MYWPSAMSAAASWPNAGEPDSKKSAATAARTRDVRTLTKRGVRRLMIRNMNAPLRQLPGRPGSAASCYQQSCLLPVIQIEESAYLTIDGPKKGVKERQRTLLLPSSRSSEANRP